MKVFVEEIVKDVITFCEYKRRKTVTPVDVIFCTEAAWKGGLWI